MTPVKLSTRPSLAILADVIMPLPKTIELGAVATGNIKAQLAVIAAGTIIDSKGKPAVIATEASIGINRAVLAVFDVVSVMKVTPRQMITINKIISY